ncbi:restriction endonuclease [Cytobacillus oceanisediminis]|uniref:restriction endonuclease n=1 Tax=Cytobacillus oceanisediminis TaxID=665099 RepID=UPI00254F04CD|nr:restriction endonuclease [Cytobacillus oceanisediminis]MDK7669177.1 restriction endonuclease [Cytobacillus oceanisediminis]
MDSFKVGLDLLWAILTAEPMLTMTLLMLFLCTLLWAILVDYLRQQKLKKSGILEVDKMAGKVFEEFLKGLLKHKGYKVSLTSITGDYGADLILSTNDNKIVVQAKRYKKKVGIKAVQEIVSAKNYYKADECWVITNNFFTAPAVNLAASNNVVLIDRDLLMKWMLERNKGGA